MKKIMLSILVLFMVLLVGCGKKQEPDVTNNLSASKGANELEGKTFRNEDATFEFGEVVTQKEGTKQIRSLLSYDEIQSFNYSWNTDAKTLEFQLNSVWGVADEAVQYENYVSLAKDRYTEIAGKIREAFADQFKAFETAFPTVAETNKKIKDQVTTAFDTYVGSQELILKDYLKSKYNSVIKFNYELKEDTLVLKEKFKNDLSDASSRFMSAAKEDFQITLNSYDEVIPFKITVGSEVYVGIPKFSSATAKNGTVEVVLYPYKGGIESITSTISSLSSVITTTITEITTNATKIFEELKDNTASATLKKAIDAKVGNQSFKANFAVSASTDGNATLKLTVTDVPTCLKDVVETGTVVDLTYTPLLQATYQIVE